MKCCWLWTVNGAGESAEFGSQNWPTGELSLNTLAISACKKPILLLRSRLQSLEWSACLSGHAQNFWAFQESEFTRGRLLRRVIDSLVQTRSSSIYCSSGDNWIGFDKPAIRTDLALPWTHRTAHIGSDRGSWQTSHRSSHRERHSLWTRTHSLTGLPPILDLFTECVKKGSLPLCHANSSRYSLLRYVQN